MSIQITEVRNAKSMNASNTSIDVEINHPEHGWIPYLLTDYDTDTTINNDELLELIGSDYAAYVAPTQASLDAIAAVAYKTARASAYPTIQEQLDMQYWDGVNGTSIWADTIASVKSENPKP